MAQKKKKKKKPAARQQPQVQRKPSKQDRRFKWVVYLMILAMLLTSFTYGLAMFVN